MSFAYYNNIKTISGAPKMAHRLLFIGFQFYFFALGFKFNL